MAWFPDVCVSYTLIIPVLPPLNPTGVETHSHLLPKTLKLFFSVMDGIERVNKR